MAGTTLLAFARMLLVLGIIVALLYGLAHLARRFQGARSSSGTGRIDVLSRRSVAKNVTLLVVRVARRTFLVAQSAQQLSLLAELDVTDWATDDSDSPGDVDQGQLLAPRTVRGGASNSPRAWDAFIDHLREMTVRR